MREMTGTEILSRRASDLMCQYDNPKLAKSRSSLELTSHGRSEPHRLDRVHERRAHGGQKSNEKVTSVPMTYSRKNSRLAQRAPEVFHKASRSKTKVEASPSVNENVDSSKNGASTSILPPISCHQIAASPNVRTGGLSPRPADGSGPTRMAVRNSPASPENAVSKSHDNHQSNSSLEGVSQSPPITGHQLVRNGSSANNVISFGRAGLVGSPESPRGQVPETSRLSPINNHDRPKVKFEKKVMKLMVDDSVPSSPRAYKLSSAETGKQHQPPSSREGGAKPRRPSLKSLPKILPVEEPFSVRRKIEQFRKWHEDHYAEALKPTTGEEVVVTSAQPNGGGQKAADKMADGVDFAKVLEENIVQNRLSTADGENRAEHSGGVGENGKQDINGNLVDKSKNSSLNKEATFPKSKLRPKSGATWKTWRDVNHSDAYNDVQKYIKDNELMDDERQKWIRTWICDVRTAMEESENMSVDE